MPRRRAPRKTAPRQPDTFHVWLAAMSWQTRRSEVRRLVSLAWPVMLAHFQWLALNLIDTAMVGRFSTTELAYLGAGRILHWTGIVVCMGLISGVTVLTARADGAGDHHRCGAILRQGIAYAIAIGGLALSILYLSGATILRLIDVPADMVAGGAGFMRILALAYVPNLVAIACHYFLEGISRPRPVMVISLSTLPLNAGLNWLFIYGNAGLPAMGADGAALGTLLSVVVGAIAVVAYIWTMPDRRRYGIGASWRGAWRDGVELRRFGLVPGLASAFELGGFSIVMAIGAALGAVPAAAFQAVISLHMASMVFMAGLASAAAVRVGNAIGAGEASAVARRGWLAAGMAAASILAIAACYLAMPRVVLAPFTADPALLVLAVDMLVLLAPFLVFDGAQAVLLYALRAAGDQVVAGVIQTFAFFVVMCGIAFALVHHTDVGALALPLSLGLGALVAFVLMAARFLMVARHPPALRKRRA